MKKINKNCTSCNYSRKPDLEFLSIIPYMAIILLPFMLGFKAVQDNSDLLGGAAVILLILVLSFAGHDDCPSADAY